jgi:hypothetical protein
VNAKMCISILTRHPVFASEILPSSAKGKYVMMKHDLDIALPECFKRIKHE